MGSAMADALARGGARVVATLEGRSERTSRLAERASVELLPDLDAVARAADVIFSIVPPEAATSVAETVRHATNGFTSKALFVELNAIAPATALQIESIVSEAGFETSTDRSPGRRRGAPGRRACTSLGHARGRSQRFLSRVST